MSIFLQVVKWIVKMLVVIPALIGRIFCASLYFFVMYIIGIFLILRYLLRLYFIRDYSERPYEKRIKKIYKKDIKKIKKSLRRLGFANTKGEKKLNETP